MSIVKYRTNNPGLSPRRTRLTIPGWGGASEPRANGSHEQPWHCIPFSEAATAGIELFYPYEDELHVRGTAAGPVFSGNALGTPDMNAEPPPFRSFGKPYYTYQCLIDLKVEAGYAIKVETHPRFYTDTTGTVPIAVPALIRHWWPMIFFVVFKTPLLGQTHIFSPGEPFIQMSVVEADAKLELMEMPEEEAAERDLQAERIYASRSILSSDTQWTSSTDTVFDGTYRKIYGGGKVRQAVRKLDAPLPQVTLANDHANAMTQEVADKVMVMMVVVEAAMIIAMMVVVIILHRHHVRCSRAGILRLGQLLV